MLSPIAKIFRIILPVYLALALLSAGVIPSSSAQAQRFPVGSTDAGQSTSARGANQTVPALFISDIHFDPFHDPGKAQQLLTAPTSHWAAILASAPMPNQQQAFDALQKQCHAKGIDTPPALLQSSLAAMKARQPDAKFMMISGDLVVHDLPCRFQTLFPGASTGDYQAFVLKTISYVLGELRASFPGMPIYTALGNNDSGCEDYKFDPNSEFFAKAGSIFALSLPAAAQQAIKKEFSAGGNYSVLMAAPMKNTRLVVLNDTLLSPKYKTCDGKRDTRGPDNEVLWLKKQLADARLIGQRVWVLGHIPPGIDPYSTVEKFKDVCGGEDPVGFLSSTTIPDLLVVYSDVVKLGVFGHTHMDEDRLLERGGGSGHATADAGVAVKVIPSITPVHGNNPSFTIARVNPTAAGIKDYTVIEASNQTGDDTKWELEYNFAKAYRQSEFSPASLKVMIDKFKSDKVAVLPESETYLRSYFVGDRSAQLSPFWMQYTCALNNYSGKAYAACVCHTGN